MRGDSSIQLATGSPNNPGLLVSCGAPCGRTRWWAIAAGLGRTGVAAAGLLGALGLGACGGGYGYPYWQEQAVDNRGKMALSWTIKGEPATAARCQSERIDWLAVDILSDVDGQSQVQFLNVVCDLSRYSVAMVPSGPVTVYLNAVHVQRDQTQCVRYGGIKRGTATAQFPDSPLAIDLKLVAACP